MKYKTFNNNYIFLVLSIIVFFFSIQNTYAGYSSNYECWTYKEGSVLKACIDIDGSSTYIRVRKTDGTKYSSSGTMKIRVGTWRTYGVVKSQKSYSSGVYYVDVPLDITYFTSGYKEFYATTANSEYYAGPIKVTATKPIPSTPGRPSASATGPTSIDISWNSVSYATQYKLYRATSSSGSYKQIDWNTDTSHTDSGSHLSSNTTYYYKVQAGNDSGWSALSSYRSVTTKKPIPSTPGRPSASATGPTSIDISWNSVSYATQYKLYRATSSSGSYKQIDWNTDTSHTDSGSHLSSNTTYYYKVQAGNDSGWSNLSSYRSVTTKKPIPLTPTKPSASATGSTSINISWNSVSYATQYKLYRATSAYGSYKQIDWNTDTSHTDSGSHLSANTTYYYKVQAGNDSGWSDLSYYRSVTTKQPTPSIPGGPSASATGSTSIDISWNSVSYATQYKLYRATSASGSYKQIDWNTDTSHTDSGTHLSPNTTYYYKVEAGNDSGWSGLSSYCSVTTKKPIPSTPGRPSASATGPTSIDIS